MRGFWIYKTNKKGIFEVRTCNKVLYSGFFDVCKYVCQVFVEEYLKANKAYIQMNIKDIQRKLSYLLPALAA